MHPPEPDEFELSLFGPGTGEGLVIHLGGGDWMVVDSCLNSDRTKAIAIEYLDSLGVDVAAAVKLVIATHWHDDHIQGLAQILQYAHNARFVCSAALRNEDFCRLVKSAQHINLIESSSGTEEFTGILDILLRQREQTGPDYWAQDRMQLLKEDRIQITALSPSSQVVTDSHILRTKFLPDVGGTRNRIPAVRPNDTSIVLLVETRTMNYLLGSDMEQGKNARYGWKAILESRAAMPFGPGATYKAAHHGSENADHDGIWKKLLLQNPYAFLTPFAKGSKPLPAPGDIARINDYTALGYITAWPPTKKARSLNKTVDRTMNEVTLSRRALRKTPGHIRLRAPLDGVFQDIKVDLFRGARKLSAI
jgi:hypothetical protein